MGEFAVSIEHSEAKCFSFRGASPPDPPSRRSAPGPRWGLRPQTPVIGSRSARSPWPPLCQILNTPLYESISDISYCDKCYCGVVRPSVCHTHTFVTLCGQNEILFVRDTQLVPSNKETLGRSTKNRFWGQTSLQVGAKPLHLRSGDASYEFSLFCN